MGIFTVFNAKNFTPSYYFLLRLVMGQARASVWVCDTVYIALLLTFIGGPINPDLETKHNCEERGVFTWEAEGERRTMVIFTRSVSLSLWQDCKVAVGAKLSDRVATQQSEKNDWLCTHVDDTIKRICFTEMDQCLMLRHMRHWLTLLWWQTECWWRLTVWWLQCLRPGVTPVLIIIPLVQTLHNEGAGHLGLLSPGWHQSMTDIFILILNSSHPDRENISWSSCDHKDHKWDKDKGSPVKLFVTQNSKKL